MKKGMTEAVVKAVTVTATNEMTDDIDGSEAVTEAMTWGE